ncbi:chorismate synthase [Marivirga harenae]|uniref:chorismate synthase n=1 Tax=Marivirga harenae TaxID=2010992 RepID=UPI0026DF33AA|nr:chorismate synthase [Marivirga harenae]WKV12705.1 chorismate synthase [Marivirga harenae]|tara:strand:+ start:71940 stop:73016 length:1077 start_codon:yes stop_codon:yes gene_type:complete
MSNSFGKIFKITTYGESHGVGIGVIIDGCPAGVKVDETFLQSEMQRRKPGQSKITTQRKEEDEVEVLSGIFEGVTTGTPIALSIRNTNQKSKDYSHIKDSFRPSHADFTYQEKYGVRDYRGGGRSSARETAARVAAGAIAKMFLRQIGVVVQAFVSQVGGLRLQRAYKEMNLSKAEENIVRCPDPEMAERMIQHIDETRKNKDTIGGIVSCVIQGTPVGLGEPVFDKLHAVLGQAMLSINAVKGFEYGSGFEGVKMYGSEHNDRFETEDGIVKTTTNHSGGIQGGISNGQDIYFNVAFKPIATIMSDQESIDKDGNKVTVKGKGRHDPCVVPRAVPIVEAMAAITIADFLLRAKTNKI